MDLKSTIQQDMKEAMKAKDSLKLGALRMLMAEIKKREIDAKAALEDGDILKVIGSLIKQRNDAIAAYQQANRPELAEKEIQERELLQNYLPAPLSEAELKELVQKAIASTGASSPRDMGKVMQAVLSQAGGRADGKVVSQMVQAELKKLG